MKWIVFTIATSGLIGLWLLMPHIRQVLKRYRLLGQRDVLPLLMALVSVGWFFWAIAFFFKQRSFYNNLVLVSSLAIVLPVAIYLGKELVPGIWLHLKGRMSKGAYLKLKDGKAVIQKSGAFGVTVTGEHSGTEFIRYSQIPVNTPPEESASDTRSDLAIVKLSLPATDMEEKLLKRKVKEVVYTCPWISPRQSPEVELSVSEDTYEIQVSAVLLEKKYQERFEIFLKDRLSCMES